MALGNVISLQKVVWMNSPIPLVFAGLLLGAATSVSAADPVVAKHVVREDQSANRIRSQAWARWEKGFEARDGQALCDNGDDPKARRGLVQTIVLDQASPEPIVAAAWSKAVGVSGAANNDYSVYLDLTYIDGGVSWGRTANFSTGTHDWQRRQVAVLPDKPIKRVDFYLLLRGHAGKAWFPTRNCGLSNRRPVPRLFDGISVVAAGAPQEGFQMRDVAANSDFVRIPGRQATSEPFLLEDDALGLKLQWRKTSRQAVSFFDVVLTDRTGTDRAVSLVFAVPASGKSTLWLEDPRRSSVVQPGREYVNATPFSLGANGRLSRYPLGAVADAKGGTAIALDPACPAFFRIGYSAGTSELYLAYDVGLTREKPQCRLQFCRFDFKADWGFRSALARYYEIFPEAFRCRTPEQGLWMPFASISKVQGWEDFGFKFKEGDNETRWDDQHGVLTFHYSEPGSWWMPMPKDMPRTYEAAMAEARRLASQGSLEANALFASGCRDANGRPVIAFEDTPWCNGAVWRMNSMPSLPGDVTDFKIKWNRPLRERLYGSRLSGDLDGEYVDSSEDPSADFCRDHFAAARTPLTFSLDDQRPVILPGLVSYE